MGSCCTKMAARQGRDSPVGSTAVPSAQSVITTVPATAVSAQPAQVAAGNSLGTTSDTPPVTPSCTSPTMVTSPTAFTSPVTALLGSSSHTSTNMSASTPVSPMTLTWKDVDRIITHTKRPLLDRLALSIRLQAALERDGVISKSLKNNLQAKQITPDEMIDQLLDHIRRGGVNRFLQFCKTLHMEGEGQLVQLMGLDIKQVTAHLDSCSASSGPQHPEKQHYYRDMETGEMLPFSTHYLPGILEHSKRCERMLMRTPLFGFDADILLDLVSLYVRTTPDWRVNESKLEKIDKLDLFRRLSKTYSPHTAELEGEPGSGKSTFLREYAHSVCKSFVDCHNKGPEVPCSGHEWKLLIYISAWTIQGTQVNAIRDSLRCAKKYKDGLMKEITEDGAGILIINDGVDELRNDSGKESTRQFTITCQETGLPRVLLSSRNGLCHVEGRYFDRHLVLQGFTPQQGVEYMVKYFKTRYSLTDHPVLTYVQQHAYQSQWILCNPLRLHITSELSARGKLTLEDMKDLSTIKLFRTLDSYILTRDVECRDADAPEAHRTNFNEMSLECILIDERRICVDRMSKKSPYLAFLNLEKDRDLEAKVHSYYTFSHEVILEFYAVQGLIQCLKSCKPYKMALLMYLCSNANMRNVLKLTVEYICGYHPDLQSYLTFIVQACLILQPEPDDDTLADSDRPCYNKTPLTEGLRLLPAVIQNTFPQHVLSCGLTTDQTRILAEVESTIARAFSHDAQDLWQAGWLMDTFRCLQGPNLVITDYQRFVSRDLLQQCGQYSPGLWEEICAKSTHRLLPCTGKVGGHDFYMVPVSSTHWGFVRLGMLNTFYVWCPQHVVAALSTITESFNRQLPHNTPVRVHLNDLWGAAPQKAWTPGVWAPTLTELLTHRVRELRVVTHHTSIAPMDGLIQAIQDVIPHDHSLTQGLIMNYGWVSEAALSKCVTWARQGSLKVKLSNTTVVESEQCEGGSDSDLQHRVQVALDGSTIHLVGGSKYKTARKA